MKLFRNKKNKSNSLIITKKDINNHDFYKRGLSLTSPSELLYNSDIINTDINKYFHSDIAKLLEKDINKFPFKVFSCRKFTIFLCFD